MIVKKQWRLWKKLFTLLPPRQKAGFGAILLILAVSAVLSQVTPLAVGYLTDSVLTSETIAVSSVIPILLVILLVNVVNEVIKVVRRLIVEDTATQGSQIEGLLRHHRHLHCPPAHHPAQLR